MGRKQKRKQIEPRTQNVRYLTEKELKSFLAWTEERRLAIDFEILDILEPDEILHIEAVIFNGLVDSYVLGRKNEFNEIKEVCPWRKIRLLR